MRTHTAARSTLSMLAMLVLGPLACGDELVPETRVWLAGRREPSTDQDEPLACKVTDVIDNQGVSIRHQLPRDVETDLPVEVLAETPCTSITATMKHTMESFGDDANGDEILRGVAQTTIAAPAGAACSLTITVEISNDRHVCSSRNEMTDVGNAADAACKDLDEVCTDALADDPERATTE